MGKQAGYFTTTRPDKFKCEVDVGGSSIYSTDQEAAAKSAISTKAKTSAVIEPLYAPPKYTTESWKDEVTDEFRNKFNQLEIVDWRGAQDAFALELGTQQDAPGKTRRSKTSVATKDAGKKRATKTLDKKRKADQLSKERIVNSDSESERPAPKKTRSTPAPVSDDEQDDISVDGKSSDEDESRKDDVVKNTPPRKVPHRCLQKRQTVELEKQIRLTRMEYRVGEMGQVLKKRLLQIAWI